MTEINLIQITEKLPPSLHGIGDYAYNLALKLQSEHSISTSFVVFEPISESSIVSLEFPIHCLTKLRATLDSTLIDLLQINNTKKNIVILHFDRGVYDDYINKNFYNRYNLPFNLLKSLTKVKNQSKNTKLIIVFHEFFSPAIERRRDYVLRPFQNIFMRAIIKTADLSFCSNPVVENQILNLYPQAKIFKSLVFSNIGESQKNISGLKKEGHWVIFGSTDNIIRTLKKFISHLNLIMTKQKIYTINILGGKRVDIILNLINEIKQHIPTVNYYPSISNQEAKEIFDISRFCYMYYFPQDFVENPALIFKSGVFAASCCHGVIPVFGNQGMKNAVGVFEHPGFVFIENNQFAFPESSKLNHISKELFNWYQKNSTLRKVTNNFYTAMRNI